MSYVEIASFLAMTKFIKRLSMSYKFFHLFLAGGILGLLILIYQLVSEYPNISTFDAVFNALLVLVFFYMAYKVRREKEDKDLM